MGLCHSLWSAPNCLTCLGFATRAGRASGLGVPALPEAQQVGARPSLSPSTDLLQTVPTGSTTEQDWRRAGPPRSLGRLPLPGGAVPKSHWVGASARLQSRHVAGGVHPSPLLFGMPGSDTPTHSLPGGYEAPPGAEGPSCSRSIRL